MTEPTKTELAQQLAEQKAKSKALADRYENMDGEARAYDRCVKALSGIPKRSQQGFRSEPSPDQAAIRRVIEALRERFELNDLDAQRPDHEWSSPEIESQDDPRDTVIAQLIDALRKS